MSTNLNLQKLPAGDLGKFPWRAGQEQCGFGGRISILSSIQIDISRHMGLLILVGSGVDLPQNLQTTNRNAFGTCSYLTFVVLRDGFEILYEYAVSFLLFSQEVDTVFSLNFI